MAGLFESLMGPNNTVDPNLPQRPFRSRLGLGLMNAGDQLLWGMNPFHRGAPPSIAGAALASGERSLDWQRKEYYRQQAEARAQKKANILADKLAAEGKTGLAELVRAMPGTAPGITTGIANRELDWEYEQHRRNQRANEWNRMMGGGAVPGAVSAPPQTPEPVSDTMAATDAPTDPVAERIAQAVDVADPSPDDLQSAQYDQTSPVTNNRVDSYLSPERLMEARENWLDGKEADAMKTLADAKMEREKFTLDQLKWASATEDRYRDDYYRDTKPHNDVIRFAEMAKRIAGEEIYTNPEIITAMIADAKAMEPNSAAMLGEVELRGQMQSWDQVLNAYREMITGKGGPQTAIAQEYVRDLLVEIQKKGKQASKDLEKIYNKTKRQVQGENRPGQPELFRWWQVVDPEFSPFESITPKGYVPRGERPDVADKFTEDAKDAAGSVGSAAEKLLEEYENRGGTTP